VRVQPLVRRRLHARRGRGRMFGRIGDRRTRWWSALSFHGRVGRSASNFI
jgi:hypothetical protein